MVGMHDRQALGRPFVSVACPIGVFCFFCVWLLGDASRGQTTPEEQLYAAIEDWQCGTVRGILIDDHPELVQKCGADLYRAAIKQRSFDLVALIGVVGVSPNSEIGQRKQTALHVAGQYPGTIHMARLLIELGADVHRRDADGNLPIHMAARTGALDLIQLYEKLDVPLDAVNREMDTLLHMASSAPIVMERNVAVVAYLIENTDAVHAENGLGQTPLHVAAASNCMKPDIVALLLKAGADPKAVDKSGKTPLDLAKSAYDSGLRLPTLRSKEIMQLLDK